MAVIAFDQEHEWGAAQWVFENLIENALRHVPPHDELRPILETALKSGSNFLDCSSFNADQRAVFLAALRMVATDAENKTGYEFASPEFYETFLTKTRQLEQIFNSLHSG